MLNPGQQAESSVTVREHMRHPLPLMSNDIPARSVSEAKSLVLAVPAICAIGDPLAVQACSFAYSTFAVTSLSGNVGSLAGGTALSLNIGGAGLPAGLPASAVSVTVGGVRCPLLGNPTSSQVMCQAPPIPAGAAFVDGWSFGLNYYPNLLALGSLAKPPTGEHHGPLRDSS